MILLANSFFAVFSNFFFPLPPAHSFISLHIKKGQGLSDGKKALYHCNYCNKDISGKIRIKCALCSDFDLCIECFSVGAEVHPHKSNHPYRVMVNNLNENLIMYPFYIITIIIYYLLFLLCIHFFKIIFNFFIPLSFLIGTLSSAPPLPFTLFYKSFMPMKSLLIFTNFTFNRTTCLFHSYVLIGVLMRRYYF